MDEHTLIQKYFSDVGSAYLADKGVRISVGDDAAVFSLPADQESIVSIDTSLEGVHFLKSMKPEDIAFRSAAIAISDLAACGATPHWYIVSITIPSFNENWIMSFTKGLQDISDQFKIPLIGGDTTKGPLSITVQVSGYCNINKSISRSNAGNGDLIFVTGVIGDASRGLSLLKKNINESKETVSYLRPSPRISIGQKLLPLASSAIDVSDGLIQDLSHICKSSEVGAHIYIESIPTSLNRTLLSSEINLGDDYELCFTAPEKHTQKINSIAAEEAVLITCIGEVIEGKEVVVLDSSGNEVEVESGYKHF